MAARRLGTRCPRFLAPHALGERRRVRRTVATRACAISALEFPHVAACDIAAPRWPQRCRTVADSGLFQGFILGVIVLNAITLGIQTYDLSSGLESASTTLDDVFLGIFVVELTIRIAAFGARPQDFFRDGWNIFDFIVIAAAFVPGVRENVTLLRILRLLRVVRLVTVLPDLRILLRAMARSIPPIMSLARADPDAHVRLRDGRLDPVRRRGSRQLGRPRPGDALDLHDADARELAAAARGRHRDPPAVVDLLRLATSCSPRSS